MNIIKTKDTSRPGNDCFINETVSLVEQFGVYAIVFCQRVDGWAECAEIHIAQVTTDRDIALKMFKDYTKPL